MISYRQADLVDRLNTHPFKITFLCEPNIIKIVFSSNWNYDDTHSLIGFISEDINKTFESDGDYKFNLRSYKLSGLETAGWMEGIRGSINRRFGTAFTMGGPDNKTLKVKLDHRDLENGL